MKYQKEYLWTQETEKLHHARYSYIPVRQKNSSEIATRLITTPLRQCGCVLYVPSDPQNADTTRVCAIYMKPHTGSLYVFHIPSAAILFSFFPLFYDVTHYLRVRFYIFIDPYRACHRCGRKKRAKEKG